MPSGPRPPLPPPLARVALSGTILTKPYTSVFYLDLGGSSISSADLNTLATQIATLWNTDIASAVTADNVLTEVAIVYVPSVGNELTGVWNGSHVGTNSGTTVNDASACFVVNFHINAYYRGGHPRMYLPGIGTTSITNGSDISAGAQSTITTAWTSFMNALNAYTTGGITSVAMGTCSFQSANLWRTTPIFRAYKSISTRSLLGSQRRRIKP